MSDDKVDATMSDEEDDELFSYLKTAHTVKHVKVDSIKTSQIVDTSESQKLATESANKSNRLDYGNKVSSRNVTESRKRVQSKVKGVKGQNHQATQWIFVNDDDYDLKQDKIHVEDSNKSRNFEIIQDPATVTSETSTYNQESCVNEADLLYTYTTNAGPNLICNEPLLPNAELQVSNYKQDNDPVNVTGIDLTEDLQHNADSETALTDIKFTQSVYTVEHKCWDNGTLGNATGVGEGSSQEELSCQENKYYLINERDWKKLFSSIQNKPQTLDMPALSDKPPAYVCDYESNVNVSANLAAPKIIPGNDSSPVDASVKHLPVVSTEVADSRSPMNQTLDTGSQNVEVVYVRIEDGKLTCDTISSPVENVNNHSPRKCNNSEDIKTKYTDECHGFNADFSVAIDNNVHKTIDETANVEDGFNGRFVRINNKLTRVFNKDDQQVLEPVLNQDDTLLEDASSREQLDNEDEVDTETAFFIDLNNWNDHQSLSENDLKIYPISIQDDSYAFLNESESGEQFVAHPVNLTEESSSNMNCELSELTNSNTLKVNEILTKSGKYSDVNSKLSDKSPMKMITFSPRKLVNSPEKKMSPIKGNVMKLSSMQAKALQISPNKSEVSKTSAQIIKDLWKNFKSDSPSVKRKLLGALSSEDYTNNGKQAVSQSVEITESTDSDSDSDGDNFLNYLSRGKRKNAPKPCHVRNSKKHGDRRFLPISCSDEIVPSKNRSTSVQTNLNDEDITFKPDQVISNRVNSNINMFINAVLDEASDIELDKQVLHIELTDGCELNDTSTEKNEIRIELLSNREFDPITEKNLKKTPGNKLSDNKSKTNKKKTCVDVQQGKAKNDKASSRKRKATSGANSEGKAKTAKVSNTEMNLSPQQKGSKARTSGSRKLQIKPSKSSQQTKGTTKASSVSKLSSKTGTNVVNKKETVFVPDKAKSNTDLENETSELTIPDCDKLDSVERTRSGQNSLKSDIDTKIGRPKLETKALKPRKKKCSTHKENSDKNVEKEKEKINTQEVTSVTETSTGKVKKTKCSSNVKQSNIKKKNNEGHKKSDNKRKGKQLHAGKERDGDEKCNPKAESKVKGKTKDKKGVEKKQHSGDVIKTMDEVLLDSAEKDDINKWGNIKNNKVDFLERLFHMKLKEATSLDGEVKDKSDTENISEKVPCEQSVNTNVVEVQNKGLEKKVRKQRNPKKHEVKLSFTEHTDVLSNTKAIENIERDKTDNTNSKLTPSDYVCDKLVDKFHSKTSKSDKTVEDQDKCKEKKARKRRKRNDNDDVNISRDVDANISDIVCDKSQDKGHSRRMKSDKIIDGAKSVIENSELKSKARTKRLSSKRKDFLKQEVTNITETQRRHSTKKSLKRLHSTLKPVSRRKADHWKEHLQDEAFKFDFDKDVYKKHAPLNVKAMIKKILKPLGSDEGRKKRREKDRNKLRKRLVKVAKHKQKTRTTSEARASESDEVWMSDSGPGGSYPAFKFTTEHQTHELYLM